ncbi:MAG: hypothetical protein KY439_06950 [Actinobacteria bacterium]|nr:hypothetical protein [Actinomycetota bacterium]
MGLHDPQERPLLCFLERSGGDLSQLLAQDFGPARCQGSVEVVDAASAWFTDAGAQRFALFTWRL